MRPNRFALALALLAGCSNSDPCASYLGACLALHLTGPISPIETLAASLDGAIHRSFRQSPQGAALPLVLPIELPDDAEGMLTIAVVGESSAGAEAGRASLTLQRLGHARADIALLALTADCHDGFLDGDESDVDCGGSCAARCVVGMSCVIDRDCGTAVCSQGHCGGYAHLSFAPPSTIQIAPVQQDPFGLLAIALRDGGPLDLVVSENNGIQRYAGNGDGTFGKASPVSVEPSSFDLAGGDFDGDGHLDIAATVGACCVRFLFGDGNGQIARRGASIDVGRFDFGLTSGDFDGDGKLDVASASSIETHQVALILGADLTRVAQTVPLAASSTALASGDLDGDGRADLVAGNNGDNNEIDVLLGGAMLAPPIVLPAASGNASSRGVAIADFDGDKVSDLVLSETAGRTVALFRGGAGGGPLKLGATFRSAPLPYTPEHLVVADFDRDGRPDIAVALVSEVKAADHIAVLRGLGDGAFAAPVLLTCGETPSRLVAADLDGDGRIDLAVTNSNDLTVMVFLNTSE